MIDLAEVGVRIADLRKSAGLTQLQLAETLHISHQAVSKWENGYSLPDPDYLVALKVYFNTTVDYLLTGSQTPSVVPVDGERTRQE